MSEAMTLVWAKYDGTYYAALLADAESMGLDPVSDPSLKCVQILDATESWVTYLASEDIIPFDYDEARLADEKAASSIGKAMELLQPAAETEDATLDDIEAAMYDDEHRDEENKREKKDKKDKKDKKAKKEERRREKERRREERAQRKRDRSPSSDDNDDDDDSDAVASPRGAAEEDDGLSAFINNESPQGGRRGGGAVVSRLHDRTKISVSTEVDPGRNYLSSVPSSLINLLHRAKSWYESNVADCKSSGKLMALHEVELLRAVELKLRNNASVLAALQRNSKNLFGAFKDRIKNEMELLKKFDVEAFCATICPLTYPPPQKPEKRKGARFFALDSQLRDQLDIGKPALQAVDPELLRKIEADERVGSAFSLKTGLVKKMIMSQWLAGRELPVVLGKTFEVQPVAAHGAVARRFSEFNTATVSKALTKANRSENLKSYIGATGNGFSRDAIGSYFNFHDFREYEQATIVHNSEHHDDAASLVPPELALEFDPDATFTADKDLAGALQAFEQSAVHVAGSSAQRSALNMPSDQSVWVVDSVASVDEGRASQGVTEAQEAQEPKPRASTSTVSSQQLWKDKVTKVIADHASLYVFGQHGRPLCLPQVEFNRVVRTCLRKTSDVQNKRDRTLSMLGGNESTWELTARDIKNIGASVEHYIRRHFLESGTAGVNPSYGGGRAHSVSRQAEYE